MITDIIIVLATVLVGALLFLPKLVKNKFWRATITPLASIIGSGFLILGPILTQNFGGFAPVAMAALCLVGFLFGMVIRFNIKMHAAQPTGKYLAHVETLSSWVLAFAYIVSVAYYLNLFGAFGVRLSDMPDATNAKILTSGILIFILLVGWLRGFHALERLEQISVSLKLAIIIGLLVGLMLFNAEHIVHNELIFSPSKDLSWPLITLSFGLIVTIQGFETSRYLGDEYDSITRINSMRFAQYISSAIYIIYIGLIAYIFKPEDFGLSETAIIDMMVVVAPILPAMLIVAALSAQFSAAIADTGGSGGLMSELTGGKIKPQYAYLILVVIGLYLTWNVNIFGIISYASRAFAFYYGLQAIIAAVFAYKSGDRSLRFYLYIGLACLGFVIAIFGTPVEA
ncbi:MAG: hypothetical protein COB24_06225 [Hyphomicrobiales bacterium]|nr:MAG: hypothetical protein COB24_06225 [Hyphomicrobiales bacterium]